MVLDACREASLAAETVSDSLEEKLELVIVGGLQRNSLYQDSSIFMSIDASFYIYRHYFISERFNLIEFIMTGRFY